MVIKIKIGVFNFIWQAINLLFEHGINLAAFLYDFILVTKNRLWILCRMQVNQVSCYNNIALEIVFDVQLTKFGVYENQIF